MNKEIATPMGRSPITGNKSADAMLYGTWDATKKVGTLIESQSPRAWNERIIKTINEKIIPKLTTEQLAWVAKHHKAIENGATVSGIVVSSAELYTVYMLTALATKRVKKQITISRFERSVRHAYQDPWFRKLHEQFQLKFQGKENVFAGLGLTVMVLLDRMNQKGEQSKVQGIFNSARNKRDAKNAIEVLFRSAKKDASRLQTRVYGVSPLSTEAIQAQAYEELKLWEGLRYWGLDGVLYTAGVDDQHVQRVYRKLQLQGSQQGRPMVVTKIEPARIHIQQAYHADDLATNVLNETPSFAKGDMPPVAKVTRIWGKLVHEETLDRKALEQLKSSKPEILDFPHSRGTNYTRQARLRPRKNENQGKY